MIPKPRPDTIPHLVLANAKRFRDEPALLRRVGGAPKGAAWEMTTWGEYGAAVRRTAQAFIASGIETGDRVAILSYNTPEWVIFNVAAMAIGAVPVGIYFMSSREEVADMMERSQARIVLCQTEAHIQLIDTDAHGAVELVIGIDEAPEGSISWSEFLERSNDVDAEVIDDRLAAIRPDDPATLIFTAVGRGEAVGVVLSHDNLIFASHSSVELFDVTKHDSALSYLPLSHVAEQIFTILAPAHVGYPVAFAQSLGRVRVDLLDIQPSIFFGVPLVWTGFERALRKQIDGLEGAKARIARWAMRTSRGNIAARNAGRRRSLYQKASMALARRTFTNRAKQAMGFANIRLAFSGAATVNPTTLEYFSGIDIPIREVYGLSEATGPSSVTREGATRFGTVGLPMPGVDITLADDGEILIKARSVFLGYLDDEDATRNALRDDWLHTGDLGSIGDDGLLSITGRKKEIIITSGGKNVDPGPIEDWLKQDPAILDAVVVGDGYDYLGVLASVAEGFAGDIEAARSHVESVVTDVNQRLSRAFHIRRVGLLSRPLSIENGERTDSGEIHRSTVVEHFAAEIETLYR